MYFGTGHAFVYISKSIPYEKDNSLNTGYAVTDLPFDLFDSIVYYPVTCSGLVF
jgi:hypothetical protein